MRKVLPVLAAAWDQTRYLSLAQPGPLGDDAVQVRRREQQDERKGLTKFDPHALTQVLKSSLFARYVSMTLLVDEVPSSLAQWSEMCPCHEPVLRGLSDHRRCRLLSRQYGCHVESCPMSNALAPELVRGKLSEALSAAWGDQQSALRAGLKPFSFLACYVTLARPHICNLFHALRTVEGGFQGAMSGQIRTRWAAERTDANVQ
eukprot:15443206-Alexandrium_andersonii.AAC.1